MAPELRVEWLLLVLCACSWAIQGADVPGVDASSLPDPRSALQRFSHWTPLPSSHPHTPQQPEKLHAPTITTADSTQAELPQAPFLKPTTDQPSGTTPTNTNHTQTIHVPVIQPVLKPTLHMPINHPNLAPTHSDTPAAHTNAPSMPSRRPHPQTQTLTPQPLPNNHLPHAQLPEPTRQETMHIIRLKTNPEESTAAAQPGTEVRTDADPDGTLPPRASSQSPDGSRILSKEPDDWPKDRVIPRGEPTSPKPKQKVPILVIAGMTLLMACCSGLGALPFFFVGKLTQRWAGLANAVACGVMLACSFDLIHEGQPYGPMLVLLGMVAGAMFIRFMQEFLDGFEDASFEDLQGADARKVILIIGVMAAHALGEGSGVGVSFSGDKGWTQGTLVTIAIGLHNIPEGLAVATVMASKGSSPISILLWSTVIALPQPLLAVPSYVFVDMFQFLLPVALGFAAGCMVWMVFAELMPDALEQVAPSQAASAASFSAAWLEGLRMLISEDGSSGAREAFLVQAGAQVLMGVVGGALPGAVAATAAGAVAAALLGPAARGGLSAGAALAQGLVWVNLARQQEEVSVWEWGFWLVAGAGCMLMGLRQLGVLRRRRVKSKLDPELGFPSLPPLRSLGPCPLLHNRGPASTSSSSSWEMVDQRVPNTAAESADGSCQVTPMKARGSWENGLHGTHPVAGRGYEFASVSFSGPGGALLGSSSSSPSSWVVWLVLVALQCCALGSLLATLAFHRVDALRRLAFPGIAQGIMVGLSAAGPACRVVSSHPSHTAFLSSFLFLLSPLTSAVALSPFPLGRSWPAGPLPSGSTNSLPSLPPSLSSYATKLQCTVAGALMVNTLVMLLSSHRRAHRRQIACGAVVGGLLTLGAACLMLLS